MASGAFGLWPGSSVTILNCVTNCPSLGCNHTCEILPGEYRARDKGRLDLLLDPSISPAALEALKKIVEEVRDGKLSPEQAETEARRVAPQIAGVACGAHGMLRSTGSRNLRP